MELIGTPKSGFVHYLSVIGAGIARPQCQNYPLLGMPTAHFDAHTHRRTFLPKRFRFIRLRPVLDISDETGLHPSRIALQRHAQAMNHTTTPRRNGAEARELAWATAKRLYGHSGS